MTSHYVTMTSHNVTMTSHYVTITTHYQFVNSHTGVHINAQDGLWHCVIIQMTGCKNLEDVLKTFRRRFNASSGINSR